MEQLFYDSECLLSTIQSIAIVLIGLACLLAFSTWRYSGYRHEGTLSWLWGFVFLALSIVLILIRHQIEDHRVLFAASCVCISLGGWFHYAGISRVLGVGDTTFRRFLFWAALVVTTASGVLLVLYNTVFISRIVANLFTLCFVVLVVVNVVAARGRVKSPQRWFIVGTLPFLAALNVASTVGTVASAFGIAAFEGWSNPFQILGPVEWILATILISACENSLVAGLISVERDQMLRRSNEQRAELVRLNTELSQFQSQILRTLAELLESRTEDASHHVKRVAELTKAIMVRLGFSNDYADFVADASTLHDVGKISIPDTVLKKDGVLEPEERVVMQNHTQAGQGLLSESDVPFFQLAAQIAAEHHECWDGSGYPLGKRGTQICLEARVVAVADSFDALTTARSYKAAWTEAEALAFLRGKAGTQFDPDVVAALVAEVDP